MDGVRIASLVPSATEMLFALGLGDRVVAVTHECDFPAEATALPRLTRSVLSDELSTSEIDVAVREITGRGDALYELNEPMLRELDIDLIVTQAVCAVCAVSYDDVRAVAARLPTTPQVLSLDPGTLDDVFADVERLATAGSAPDAGESLRRGLEKRLGKITDAVAGADRPRALALEWLDPPFVGGHWVPQMIAFAGGEDAFGVPAGAPSRTVTWDELALTEPDVIVVMPCGYGAERAATEVRTYAPDIAALGASSVYAVDAAASFSRPGPRLVEGVELLAHLFHRDLASPPAAVAYADVSGIVASRRPDRARPPM